jgi:hypothetical protein
MTRRAVCHRTRPNEKAACQPAAADYVHYHNMKKRQKWLLKRFYVFKNKRNI